MDKREITEQLRRGSIALSVLSLTLLASCAHVPAPASPASNPAESQAQAPVPVVAKSDSEWVVSGIKLENTDFDIPVEVNSQVEQWVEYFTGRGRKYFDLYLLRAEFFIPYIIPILKENSLPSDLVYLAMIESGFNNHARSRARAVGPWQFISATGKRYGLKVNWWIDERHDIRKSTLAAVQYLRDLYEMFGTWELAAAAYNAGESKVARAIGRYGTKDFWVLAKHRFFKPETRNYVPKMIAAALVAKNRTQFGFSESHSRDLLRALDEQSDAEAEVLPDTLSKDIESEEDLTDEGSEAVAQQGPESATDAERGIARIPTPHVSKRGEVRGEDVVEIELDSPADMLKIADAAGLTYPAIKALNPEILRWCTPPMMKTFRVKLPSHTKDRFLATYNHPAFRREIEFRIYRVKSGDTVQRIARRFGIREEPLRDLNQIPVGGALSPGSEIYLPMPTDARRSLAALELHDVYDSGPKKRHRAKRGNYRVTLKARNSPAPRTGAL